MNRPRDTSIEVYHRIEAEGLLSKLRFKVYKILFEHGPLTAMEVCQITNGVKQVSISPRMSELVERGVACEVGEKICSVTGNNSILWDVTSRYPTKPEPKTSEIARLKLANEKLRAENDELRYRLSRSPSVRTRPGSIQHEIRQANLFAPLPEDSDPET